MRIYQTPEIMQIFNLYDDVREAHNAGQSIIQLQDDSTWGDSLTRQYSPSIFRGLEYPVLDGVYKQANAKIQETNDSDIKNHYKYFNEVYNICAQYIKENQDRNYFQRADLDNLAHHKVFAITLIANLCRHAVEGKMPRVYGEDKQISEQENLANYKNRIKQFITSLLSHEYIPFDNQSAQTNFKSCAETLAEIKDYEVHAIDQDSFLHNISEDIKQLNNTIASLDQLLNELLQAAGRPIDISFNFENSFLYRQLTAASKANVIALITTKAQLQGLNSTLSKYMLLYQGNNIKFEQFLSFHASSLIKIRGDVYDLYQQFKEFDRNAQAVYLKEDVPNDDRKIAWDAIFSYTPSLPVTNNIKISASRLSETMRSSPNTYYTPSHELETENNPADNNPAEDDAQRDNIAQSQRMISKLADMIGQYHSASNSTKNELKKEFYQAQISKLQELTNKIQTELRDNAIATQANIDNAAGFVFVDWNDIDREYLEQLEQSRAYLSVRNDASAEQIVVLTNQVDELTTRNDQQEVTIIDQENQIQQLWQQNSELRPNGERLDYTLKFASFSSIISKQNYQEIVYVLQNKAVPIAEDDEEPQAIPSLTINNENLKKLNEIVAKVDAAIKLGQEVKNAYGLASALKKDNSFFFSHNKNGRAHAKVVMDFWEQSLTKKINNRIGQVLSNMNNKLVKLVDPQGPFRDGNGAVIDALVQDDWDTMLSALDANIDQMLKTTVNDLILREDYSSYKSHSFRSYLHWMHKEFNQPQERDADVVLNSREIFKEVNDAKYNKESLKAEERAFKNS